MSKSTPKRVATFTSYIPAIEIIKDSCHDELTLKFLPGETVVNTIDGVLRYFNPCACNNGLSGLFILTNFRIRFNCPKEDKPFSKIFRNKLVSDDDIVLANIRDIYLVSTSNGNKRTSLQLSSSINEPVEDLEICCKDFSVHTFGFKLCKNSNPKPLILAILSHAFPTRMDCLFGAIGSPQKRSLHGSISLWRDNKSVRAMTPESDPQILSPGGIRKIPRYITMNDWESELSTHEAHGFAVPAYNHKFSVCSTLPPYCATFPAEKFNVSQEASKFTGNRYPVWSYTFRGNTIMKMAYPLNTQEDIEFKITRTLSEIMKEDQSVSSTARPFSQCLDLGKMMPSLQELQTSLEKLQDICTPMSDLESDDYNWYSKLESTKWPSAVMCCLQVADQVHSALHDKKHSVILKEFEYRDWAPLISCLVQLLLDPICRTLGGFEALVEREWVVMGHQFTDRCSLIRNPKAVKSPVFLLFLDCVWQLLQQFPDRFEFSEIYLTTIWDSLCKGLLHNLVFNSCQERLDHHRSTLQRTTSANPQKVSFRSRVQGQGQGQSHQSSTLPDKMTTLQLHSQVEDKCLNCLSLWDWDVQLSPEDQLFFLNPLYVGMREAFGPEWGDKEMLRVTSSMPTYKHWGQCYLRWLFSAQVNNGGSPVKYLHECRLVEEIRALELKIANHPRNRPIKSQLNNPSDKNDRPKEESEEFERKTRLVLSIPSSDEFFCEAHKINSSFPFFPNHKRTPSMSQLIVVENKRRVVSAGDDVESIDGLDNRSIDSLEGSLAYSSTEITQSGSSAAQQISQSAHG